MAKSVGIGEVKQPEEEVKEIVPLPKPAPRSVNYKPKPLPIWRKLIALVSAIVALGVFLYAMSITDLSAIINSSVITAQGGEQLFLYIQDKSAFFCCERATKRCVK